LSPENKGKVSVKNGGKWGEKQRKEVFKRKGNDRREG